MFLMTSAAARGMTTYRPRAPRNNTLIQTYYGTFCTRGTAALVIGRCRALQDEVQFSALDVAVQERFSKDTEHVSGPGSAVGTGSDSYPAKTREITMMNASGHGISSNSRSKYNKSYLPKIR